MNDNKLFGAIVAASLITEGKFADAAKAVNRSLPSVVRGTGAATEYVGKQIKTAGKNIHTFGTPRKISDQPPTTTKTKTGGWEKFLSAGRTAAGATTRGVGATIKGVGGAVETVGKDLQKGGTKWQEFRANSLQSKKVAEEAAETESHSKELTKIKREQEKEKLQKGYDREHIIKDANVNKRVKKTLTEPLPPKKTKSELEAEADLENRKIEANRASDIAATRHTRNLQDVAKGTALKAELKTFQGNKNLKSG